MLTIRQTLPKFPTATALYILISLTSIIFSSSHVNAADVTLAWDPNSEPDLAGYVIYWGTSSHSYTFSADVGNTTTHTLSGLDIGQTYYIAATAYDTSNNESGYSNEVIYTVSAPDTDADGISDSDETDIYGTDPSLADTDADGIDDGTELSLWGADWNGDPDGDGLVNLLDPDSDNDGFDDGIDSAPADPTIPVVDSDGDGISDNDESNIYGTQPNLADTDADGIDDGAELSLWGANWNGDLDGDGLVNLLDPDSDNDDMLDGTDPTPGIPNHKPQAPQLNSPVDHDLGTESSPSLITDGFIDPDGNDYHAQTQWQIYRASDDLCVFDITTEIFLTAIDVPILVLDEGLSYNWKVRFYDNHGAVSDWSQTFTFTTAVSNNDLNTNGIPDSKEAAPSVDLDEDGVADNFQTDVIKTINSAGGQGQFGVSIRNASAIASIDAVDVIGLNEIADTLNRPLEMPLDLVCFKLLLDHPGDTVDVEVFFSVPADPDAKWIKHDAVNGWKDYSAMVAYSSDRKSVVVTLEDGGDGDADGIANGILVDPAGLASLFGGDSDSDDDGTQEGCFIATAAYGSYIENHVMVLRHFRDQILLSNSLGTAAVHFYYKHSPPMADYIAEHRNLRKAVRWSLLPVIGLSWVALKIGFWPTLAGFMLLVVVMVSSVKTAYRRGQKHS